KLKLFETANTGNIVTDSLVGYWKRTAENKGIEFQAELSIPMDIPFKGADVSLILGNLLENAVEGAAKAEEKRYIRLKIKYDKKNLLIMVENSYKGDLIKGKGEELRTTKADTANHGIGLASVRRTVGKYHGIVSIDDSVPGRFAIRAVLYGEQKGE
ncbi:MAG: ATP-binding protein, partial [Lachnospiraceae bacterium]|nr:ATP-binding protein [Lachnospiraceae bacterium]